jgi:hypothetical protein
LDSSSRDSDATRASGGFPPVLVGMAVDVVGNFTRACRQLSQTTLATSWTAARKLRAVLSYRVAIARNCLILAKKFSIR